MALTTQQRSFIIMQLHPWKLADTAGNSQTTLTLRLRQSLHNEFRSEARVTVLSEGRLGEDLSAPRVNLPCILRLPGLQSTAGGRRASPQERKLQKG